MGLIRPVTPVKLFIGIICAPHTARTPIERVLARQFGPIDDRGEGIPFTATDYYAPEMGASLTKSFYSFARLISPDALTRIKLFTNRLERRFLTRQGNRTVNLDPGYLNESKVVLATTKDHQHRMYLGRGLYAEVTLRFRQGAYIPWEWTYPDYRTPAYGEFFTRIRARYRAQITGVAKRQKTR